MAVTERFSLKDYLFNEVKVKYLAGLIKKADKGFNDKEFIAETMSGFNDLELKQRIEKITIALEELLPTDFTKACNLIIKSLPAPLDPTNTDNDFGDFIFAPFGLYVVRNGNEKKHLHKSLNTLKEITKRFSMEDAIRTFINHFPAETNKELEKWSKDKNYHVRRLVSEGTRPTLPWSARLSVDYKSFISLLDNLYADNTRYVVRSVANHLNDIAKIDANIVIKLLKKWQKEGKQETKEFSWLSRHALRTLIKQGNEKALNFLGYKANLQIGEVKLTSLPTKNVKLGEKIQLDLAFTAKEAGDVVVDYSIDFVRKRNTGNKVFKWKNLTVRKGERVVLSKKHHFKKDATTFKLYAGKHKITILINGQQVCSLDLALG